MYILGDVSDPLLVSEEVEEGVEGRGGGESGEGAKEDQLVLGSSEGHVDTPPVTEEVADLHTQDHT